MNDTTATTGGTSTVSIAAMTRAMQEVDLLPLPDQWVVIDPQGRVYKGKVEDVARVLLAEHPLLKFSTKPPPFFNTPISGGTSAA
ncbi:MAG: hypothetical protein Q8K24_08960 [Hydrogenophaga sp.]|nr:hypothetical protein [Hydrogenophaga sp.]